MSNDPIYEACKSYMDFINSDDLNEDRLEDYENDVFEAAMDKHFPGWADILNSKI